MTLIYFIKEIFPKKITHKSFYVRMYVRKVPVPSHTLVFESDGTENVSTIHTYISNNFNYVSAYVRTF